MIISHKYKYLFVELPLTGSTAIANELLEYYGGERMLMKHSTYEDFRRAADGRWSDYYTFSGIRNPLDQVVSQYAKLKADHKGKYSKLSERRRARGMHFLIHWWLENRKFAFIADESASFEEFFRRYYRLPYSDWSMLSHKKFNAVIRFESIVDDFDSVLRALGIEPTRRLPVVNQSAGKGDWRVYFQSEDVRAQAVRVFGPFMQYWNYAFPEEWGRSEPTLLNQIAFDIVNRCRSLYWRYLRYRF